MQHTVLLVDDDENLLAGYVRSLRKENYEVVCAASPDEALDVLRSRTVDVVVSDQEMPGMKGTDFLKRVNSEFPDTVRFMITGNATLEVAVEAINSGAISRFFVKPCNLIDLAASIRQALHQRELLVQARRLLGKVKTQSETLKRLEVDNPGITRVDRDASGAICIEDSVDDNIEGLLKDIRTALKSGE